MNWDKNAPSINELRDEKEFEDRVHLTWESSFTNPLNKPNDCISQNVIEQHDENWYTILCPLELNFAPSISSADFTSNLKILVSSSAKILINLGKKAWFFAYLVTEAKMSTSLIKIDSMINVIPLNYSELL